MGRVTLTLPRLGETMEEARVTDWLVPPGTAFRRGDVLLEVETDKTVVEVPALTDGTLLEQLVHPGEMVALDHPIALVEAEGAETTPEPAPQTAPAAPAPAAAAQAPIPARSATPRPAASPAARAAARRSGADLALVAGTGRRGRITAADVSANGENPPHQSPASIVLLHGLFDSPKGWRDLPRRLAAVGHSVLAPDLPGHGDSAPAASLDDAATALARTITTAIPQGSLILVGHSLGAALAVKVAALMPHRIAQLVLSAPAGLGPRINPDFTQGMLAAETPQALARALSLLDAGPLSPTALAQELARLKAQRAGHAPLAAALSSHGFQQIDITADLARLTCATTVIFGTADRILDWRCIEHLPATAAIHLIRGAGHLPHHADPDLLLSLVSTPAQRSTATRA